MDFLQNLFESKYQETVKYVSSHLQKLDSSNIQYFILAVIISLIIGRYTPLIIRLIISRIFSHEFTNINDKILKPVNKLLKLAGTLALITLSSIIFISHYKPVYDFLRWVLDFVLISTVAWLFSRLLHLYIHTYGINLARKIISNQIDDLIFIFETIVNIIIGFIAVVVFSQGRYDLGGVFTGLGIGGVAVAFAAQKTLEQVLGTLVLYLDRPFAPGEYIRIPSFNQFDEGLFGRVESIGLRSTKIRTAAKSTLIIVPNSILANIEVENITRGKKLMVLLYLNFEKKLEDKETALVRQVIQESTNSLLGIDPGSTSIALSENEKTGKSRARVSFFILGSTDNSIELRKQLLKLANDRVSERLDNYNISFVLEEPNIYVESPVTI